MIMNVNLEKIENFCLILILSYLLIYVNKGKRKRATHPRQLFQTSDPIYYSNEA